jgi:PAS domain S-box-containing protein
MHNTLLSSTNVSFQDTDLLHKLSHSHHLLSKHGQASDIYQALHDHSIIAIADKQGVLTYVNDKFCTISQYLPEELLGHTHRINKSGYHPDSFFAGLWKTISAAEVWKGEIKNRAKDGSYYWVQTVIIPLVDKHGVPEYYLSIHTDTTASKRAEETIKELLTEAQETNEELKASEEELRQTLEHAVAVNNKIAQSEKMYRLISESMSDMICLHEMNGRYTYISPSVKTLLGYEPEELLGTYPYDLFHSEDINRIIQSHHNALKGSQDNYIQYRIKKKTGDYIWFETLTQTLKDESGNITHLHTASRDITRRKQAEDQRDNFFSYSMDLMIITDLDSRILRVNNSWEKTFGYTDAELKGQPLISFLHTADFGITMQAKLKEQETGQPSIDFENRYRCKDSSYKWLSWNSITFVKDGVMYGFARDITEKKQREEVLKNTLEELQVRNHELDNYVYKVSHDLRAPLCSIRGLIDLVKMEKDVPAIHHYISLIENRINKSDQFILSIINHSKILNSQPNIELINFEKIIDDCFEELKYIPNTSRIQKQVVKQGLSPFYNDELRISILLKNFISNSIKYLNPKSENNYLRFTICIDSEKAHLHIKDNGIGIEKELIPRMFDMFFRGTQLSEGSGMGLYIVKQTIDKMGGTISVESEPGIGTSFSLMLPNFSSAAQNS